MALLSIRNIYYRFMEFENLRLACNRHPLDHRKADELECIWHVGDCDF
jgi:hypothetical protein